jgi:hypothetical protein
MLREMGPGFPKLAADLEVAGIPIFKQARAGDNKADGLPFDHWDFRTVRLLRLVTHQASVLLDSAVRDLWSTNSPRASCCPYRERYAASAAHHH